MKPKDSKEIRTKTKAELEVLVAKTSQELVKWQFDLAAGRRRDASQFKIKKRDLARLKTILTEKEFNENEAR